MLFYLVEIRFSSACMGPSSLGVSEVQKSSNSVLLLMNTMSFSDCFCGVIWVFLGVKY